MGSPYNTNPDSITFKTIASGSVVVGGNIGVPSGSSGSSALSSAQNINTQNTAVGPFGLVGATYTASGFTTEATSAVNIALILGITIPLVVIFIVVVVVIVIKVKNNKNQVS